MIVNRKGVVLTECPFCGSEDFYLKVYVSGHTEYNYRFDGFDVDNSSFHDSLSYQEYKSAFCGSCRKKIGTRKEPDK